MTAERRAYGRTCSRCGADKAEAKKYGIRCEMPYWRHRWMRSKAETPPEPRCCKARCGATLAEHEVTPPRAGTYHDAVWRWQRRLGRA